MQLIVHVVLTFKMNILLYLMLFSLLMHCRIDVYIEAWTKNVDLQPVITKIIKQELIAVFIQALHRNE